MFSIVPLVVVAHVYVLIYHRSALGRVCLVILGVVMMIFFVSLGGSKTKETVETNLRSGQAMHPTKATTTTTTTSTLGVKQQTNAGDAKDSSGNLWKGDTHEKSLEETLEIAVEDVDKAAEDQVEKNEQGLLSKAMSSMESGIRNSVAKLLGADASGTDINKLTQEVEGALVNNATEELQQRAVGIADQESNGIHSLIEMGEAMGQANGDMTQEVNDVEADTVIRVRDAVDNAALDIRQHLRERAAQLEKTIMEKRLSERLGRPIKLQIVDGDVEFAIDPVALPQVPPQYAQQPGTQATWGQPGIPQQGGYAQQPPPQNGYYPPPPQQEGLQTRYQQPPPQGGYQPPPQGLYPQQPYNPQQGYGAQPPPQGSGQQLSYPVPGGTAPAGGYQAPQGDGAYAPPQAVGGLRAYGTPPAGDANLGAPVNPAEDETADDESSDEEEGETGEDE